jgi:hypothetical protein
MSTTTNQVHSNAERLVIPTTHTFPLPSGDTIIFTLPSSKATLDALDAKILLCLLNYLQHVPPSNLDPHVDPTINRIERRIDALSHADLGLWLRGLMYPVYDDDDMLVEVLRDLRAFDDDFWRRRKRCNEPLRRQALRDAEYDSDSSVDLWHADTVVEEARGESERKEQRERHIKLPKETTDPAKPTLFQKYRTIQAYHKAIHEVHIDEDKPGMRLTGHLDGVDDYDNTYFPPSAAARLWMRRSA